MKVRINKDYLLRLFQKIDKGTDIGQITYY